MKNLIILVVMLISSTLSAGKKENEAFYRKFKKAEDVVLIKGSDLIKDESLDEASKIIKGMLLKRPDIANRLNKEKVEVAIFAHDENFCSIPEVKGQVKFKALGGRNYCDLCGSFYESLNPPLLLVCEDNLLKTKFDPYKGKTSVLTHEFGHMIHAIGLTYTEKREVTKIYKSAKKREIYTKNSKGLSTYMMETEYEFWATMTEVWFNVHDSQNPAISQELINRESIKEKLPEMYEFLSTIYPE